VSDIKSLLPELLSAGDSGLVGSFDQFMHDDVVVHAPAGLSTVGLENEKESWRKAKATMPDIHHEVLVVVAEAPFVAAKCVVSGTLRGSYGTFTAEGRSFKVDQALFAHVRDGKIDELWEIVDTATANEQLSTSSG
jgi:predicted ester cyclase